jgi:hypothetical protein
MVACQELLNFLFHPTHNERPTIAGTVWFWLLVAMFQSTAGGAGGRLLMMSTLAAQPTRFTVAMTRDS